MSVAFAVSAFCALVVSVEIAVAFVAISVAFVAMFVAFVAMSVSFASSAVSARVISAAIAVFNCSSAVSARVISAAIAVFNCPSAEVARVVSVTIAVAFVAISVAFVEMFVALATSAAVARLSSAAIAAIYPHFVFYSVSGLTEVFYTFLLLLSIFLFYKKYIVLGIIISILGLLVKPSLDFLNPILVFMFVIFVHKMDWRKASKYLGIYFISYIIIMSPWWIHNIKSMTHLLD